MHNVIRLNKSFPEVFLLELYDSLRFATSQSAGFPGEGNVDWSSTTLYARNSNNALFKENMILRKLLDDLDLDIRLARIMTLGPYGVIKRHRDAFLSSKIVRLHIPIQTNPDFIFFINDERCIWKPGELWYGDFSKEHYGENKGNLDRIHLVLDVDVNKNFIDLLPEEETLKYQFESELDGYGSKSISTEYFCCTFKFPKDLQLPLIDTSQIGDDVFLTISSHKGSLYLTMNNQPFLNLVTLSEDTLLVEGLDGMDIFLKFQFGRDNTKDLNLIIDNNIIPLEIVS